jgi:hypothetical protein
MNGSKALKEQILLKLSALPKVLARHGLTIFDSQVNYRVDIEILNSGERNDDPIH